MTTNICFMSEKDRLQLPPALRFAHRLFVLDDIRGSTLLVSDRTEPGRGLSVTVPADSVFQKDQVCRICKVAGLCEPDDCFLNADDRDFSLSTNRNHLECTGMTDDMCEDILEEFFGTKDWRDAALSPVNMLVFDAMRQAKACGECVDVPDGKRPYEYIRAVAYTDINDLLKECDDNCVIIGDGLATWLYTAYVRVACRVWRAVHPLENL